MEYCELYQNIFIIFNWISAEYFTHLQLKFNAISAYKLGRIFTNRDWL